VIATVPDLFAQLGDRVEHAWRAVGYDERAFPTLAVAALEASPPAAQLGAADVLAWAARGEALPSQHVDSAFGKPPIQVYNGPGFYIQVLHWLDATTSIHEHGFSGAFHVVAGSSIHSRYRFDEERRYTTRVRTGRLTLLASELLRAGDTRPIVGGAASAHALFHLERPSVTVVVRLPTLPGTSPQYDYHPPGLAIDPFHRPPALVRRVQALHTLAEIGHPGLDTLHADVARDADPHALCRLALDLDLAPAALDNARGRWPELVALLERVVAERTRERLVVALRHKLHDPDHRFLLALLLTQPSADAMLTLVAQRHPGAIPDELVMRWIGELGHALFDFSLDPSTLDAMRRMLGGRSFETVVADLREDYEDVDAQLDDLRQIFMAVRGSRLVGPLFLD
jgi:hypothetical protein